MPYEIIQALLAAGADPNIQNRNGVTALMIAASKGNNSVATALLRAGADANILDNERETALDHALSAFEADETNQELQAVINRLAAATHIPQ